MKPCIFHSGAYVDLKAIKKSKAAEQQSSSLELKSDIIFKTIGERMNENIEKAKSINGVFLYNITKNGRVEKKWSKFLLHKIAPQPN